MEKHKINRKSLNKMYSKDIQIAVTVDCIEFKGRKRIDWEKTEQNVHQFYLKHYEPAENPFFAAMTVADLCDCIQLQVRKFGLHSIKTYLEKHPRKVENAATPA